LAGTVRACLGDLLTKFSHPALPLFVGARSSGDEYALSFAVCELNLLNIAGF
jgi:hypothetical protein